MAPPSADELADALRVRVHGLTAARPGPGARPAPKKPKNWDEGKVGKGYGGKRTRRFEESQVVRDMDPGEEGQFDFKESSKRKGGGKTKSDSEKAAEKAERDKRNAQAMLAKGPIDSKSERQSLVAKAIREGWKYKQYEDGSGFVDTPAGRVDLPSDDDLEAPKKAKEAEREAERNRKTAEREAERSKAQAERDEREARALMARGPVTTEGQRQSLVSRAIREDWKYEQKDDGSGWIDTPAGRIDLPSDKDLQDMADQRSEDARSRRRSSSSSSSSSSTSKSTPAPRAKTIDDLAIDQNLPVPERIAALQRALGNVTDATLRRQIERELDALLREQSRTASAIVARGWSADQRKDAAVRGQALPDGSYPIKSKADWYKARQALGRAKNRAAVVRHLKKRAKTLGIPESELEGITAAIGVWDESLHPRGRDGKFIEKLGWVRGLFKFDGEPGRGAVEKVGDRHRVERIQVVGFAQNTEDASDPYVVIEMPKTKERGYALASEVEQVARPKADVESDVRGERGLPIEDEEFLDELDATDQLAPTAKTVYEAMSKGSHRTRFDFGQLINLPELRSIGALDLRQALRELVEAGLVTGTGGGTGALREEYQLA